MAGDKFQFTSNENPIVYTSALIVINSRMVTGCEGRGIEWEKKANTWNGTNETSAMLAEFSVKTVQRNNKH